MWDTKASERCLKRDTPEPTCHPCDTAVAPIQPQRPSGIHMSTLQSQARLSAGRLEPSAWLKLASRQPIIARNREAKLVTVDNSDYTHNGASVIRSRLVSASIQQRGLCTQARKPPAAFSRLRLPTAKELGALHCRE